MGSRQFCGDDLLALPRAHHQSRSPVIDTLRIEWPSGIVRELANLAPNRVHTVMEMEPVLASRLARLAWSRALEGAVAAAVVDGVGNSFVLHGGWVSRLDTWGQLVWSSASPNTIPGSSPLRGLSSTGLGLDAQGQLGPGAQGGLNWGGQPYYFLAAAKLDGNGQFLWANYVPELPGF
jgi:hypothetical protein